MPADAIQGVTTNIHPRNAHVTMAQDVRRTRRPATFVTATQSVPISRVTVTRTLGVMKTRRQAPFVTAIQSVPVRGVTAITVQVARWIRRGRLATAIPEVCWWDDLSL